MLNESTIPLLNTKIICGASNCPVDRMEDYKTLADMKITHATDVVPNRMVNEPEHDKTYKMACVPSEDSDQPVHLPSLISLLCVLSW